MTPPLAPPKGMLTTAHFQVIHAGRALVQGDVLVVPDAALARSAGDVVEDAVPDEDLDPSVVHDDRDRNLGLPDRLAKHLVEAGVEPQLLGRDVEPGHHLLEGARGVHSLGRASDRGELRFGDLGHAASSAGEAPGSNYNGCRIVMD